MTGQDVSPSDQMNAKKQDHGEILTGYYDVQTSVGFALRTSQADRGAG